MLPTGAVPKCTTRDSRQRCVRRHNRHHGIPSGDVDREASPGDTGPACSHGLGPAYASAPIRGYVPGEGMQPLRWDGLSASKASGTTNPGRGRDSAAVPHSRGLPLVSSGRWRSLSALSADSHILRQSFGCTRPSRHPQQDGEMRVRSQVKRAPGDFAPVPAVPDVGNSGTHI
jgi:hypothetical protein